MWKYYDVFQIKFIEYENLLRGSEEMICTSNYAKHNDHPLAISISRFTPHFFKGRTYIALAPTESILAEWRTAIASNDAKRIKEAKKRFTERYKTEVLANLDPMKVWKDIGNKAILLCYEGPTEFCHRHIVAEWLAEKLEMTIEEIPKSKQKI